MCSESHGETETSEGWSGRSDSYTAIAALPSSPVSPAARSLRADQAVLMSVIWGVTALGGVLAVVLRRSRPEGYARIGRQ
jgi:hypothetical protein